MAIRREGFVSQGTAILWNTPGPLHRVKGTSHKRYCWLLTRDDFVTQVVCQIKEIKMQGTG